MQFSSYNQVEPPRKGTGLQGVGLWQQKSPTRDNKMA